MSDSILPRSGVVLGALVDDLRLSLAAELKKTAREYFSGRRPIIKDDTHQKIITSIARSLVEQGFIPPFRDSSEQMPTVALMSCAITAAAVQWDDVVGRIQSETLDAVAPDVAALACMRLVVVDLSVRAAATLRLAAGRPPTCKCDLCLFGNLIEPRWPHKNGQQMMIRAIISETGAASLEEFAHLLGYSDGAVDGWLRSELPSRPEPAGIEALATAMAKLPNEMDSKEEWQLGLTWRFALSAVADRLAAVIGQPRVIALGSFLERCFAVLVEVLRRDPTSPAKFRHRMEDLLVRGTRGGLAAPLLDILADAEIDPECRHAIKAASTDWMPVILAALGKSAARARAAEVLVHEDKISGVGADLILELVNQPKVREMLTHHASHSAKADALVFLASEARACGDLRGSAAYLRGAVTLDPSRPELHQDLGGTLGKLGAFDEALVECRRALELRPGWHSPLVQIGIILLDAGRDAEALHHLEDIVEHVPWTATLGHSLGLAQMRAHRFVDAIASFERVLANSPNHGLALDSAAHCYLMLRDWTRGRELAKRAHALARDETWIALERGDYRRLAAAEDAVSSEDREKD